MAHQLETGSEQKPRNVFNKFKVERELGLTLIHRHFDLLPGERLVEYENVATPWVMSEVSPLLRGRIHAKRWAFVNDSLYPYEFNFSSHPMDSEYEFNPEFLAAFSSVLREQNLETTLGLAHTPESTWRAGNASLVEFTAGRTSVLVPMTPELENAFLTEAQWVFPCIWDPVKDEGIRSRFCMVKCLGHELDT